MDPTAVYQAYQAVRACYKGGKFLYKLADKRVANYAKDEGISKQEAWARVRAEAKRQGDERVEQAADLAAKAGPIVGAVLIPGGPLLVPLALAWKRRRGAR